MSMTLNTSKLKDFRRMLTVQGKHRVHVGIFANHNSRDDGTSNAEVGAKNEFGTSEESATSGDPRGRGPMKWSGAPQRSFLRVPLTTELPGVVASEMGSIGQTVIEHGIDAALEDLGFLGEAVVQEAFDTQGFGVWPDNSLRTRRWKAKNPGPGGANKPLNDSLQLRESISSRVVKRGAE